MHGDRVHRRQVLSGAGLLAVAAVGGCGERDRRSRPVDRAGTSVTPPSERSSGTAGVAQGRLTHRPSLGAAAPTGRARTGTYEVPVGGGRPAVVHVPEVDATLRLVVLLHGAGGLPQRTIELLVPFAAQHRLLLVAPASRSATWDVIAGGFGPDVRTVDTLLGDLSAEHRVDGLTVGGFSDGASYALTLGLGNGDVFDSVVAFSPGFQAAAARHGRPRFYVSHGTRDEVLPIDACSRRLVPALEQLGYDVTYEEFDGPHHVPVHVRRSAVDWLTGG